MEIFKCGCFMIIIRFISAVLLAMLCVCYVYNKSIISYIVQQYHYASDMVGTTYSFFSFGDMIAEQLEKMRVAIFEGEFHATEDALELAKIKDGEVLESKYIAKIDSNLATTNTSKPILQEKKLINIESAHTETTYNIENSNKMLILPPQTRFLLIGDSLMQGIGMVLPRMLQQHGFIVKNLSKQSTGLTYPSFFNWEMATIQAFQQYKDIGVLVVCLGANDPWNMPKMRFASQSWEEVYKKRIQAIINVAKLHGAEVVWYAVPMTKNESLNKKLVYLNNLYYQVVSANGGIFLTADAILHDGKFSSYIKDKSGKSRLVRSQDGIHFTVYGSRLLAKTLIDRISLPSKNLEPKTKI